MSINLTKIPTDISKIIQSFLPTAGTLSSTISKSMYEALKKTADWSNAAKQYGFKILDLTKAKEEFIAQYEQLKRTNALLLEKFPSLARKCTNKDPIELSREISRSLKTNPKDPEISLQAKNLANEIISTKKDTMSLARALISLLKINKTINLPSTTWVALGDKHIEIFECLLESSSPNNTFMLLSFCIENRKINHVNAIIKGHKYQPNQTHIELAVLLIRNGLNEDEKKPFKEILNIMFENASKDEKKKINAIIKVNKKGPINLNQLNKLTALNHLFGGLL